MWSCRDQRKIQNAESELLPGEIKVEAGSLRPSLLKFAGTPSIPTPFPCAGFVSTSEFFSTLCRLCALHPLSLFWDAAH